jgi:hypothetical protein
MDYGVHAGSFWPSSSAAYSPPRRGRRRHAVAATNWPHEEEAATPGINLRRPRVLGWTRISSPSLIVNPLNLEIYLAFWQYFFFEKEDQEERLACPKKIALHTGQTADPNIRKTSEKWIPGSRGSSMCLTLPEVTRLGLEYQLIRSRKSFPCLYAYG